MPAKAIIWGALILSVAVLAGTVPLSASALLAEIDAVGPRAVVDRLAGDEALLDSLTSAIESGDGEWLNVARRLKPGSDAGIALTINFSVARALPKSPEAVLRLIGHGFTIHDVCTIPFIEPDPGVAEAYVQSADAALARVTASSLRAVRDECKRRISQPNQSDKPEKPRG